MASSNEEVKFNYDNIHPVDFRLLDEQVNAKSNNESDEIPVTIGRKILQSSNLLKIIPNDKEIQAV